MDKVALAKELVALAKSLNKKAEADDISDAIKDLQFALSAYKKVVRGDKIPTRDLDREAEKLKEACNQFSMHCAQALEDTENPDITKE